MPSRIFLIAFLPLTLGAVAVADDKITLHDGLHANQKVVFSIEWDDKNKSISTTNGVPTVLDSEIHNVWKVTMNYLDVRDGTGTRARADVDAGSYDLLRSAGVADQKSACPFAGRGVVITRHADESITNDFVGADPNGDGSLLNACLNPDGDYFPDTPVSVGDVWDNAPKASKHAGLGPNDQYSSHCHLDSVKIINGKKIAQISDAVAIVMHEDGNVKETMQFNIIDLVDVDAGMIVKCDETGSSTYSTPASNPTQVTGGQTFAFHAEVLPDAAAAPATAP